MELEECACESVDFGGYLQLKRHTLYPSRADCTNSETSSNMASCN
jgi:hypothetical protein